MSFKCEKYKEMGRQKAIRPLPLKTNKQSNLEPTSAKTEGKTATTKNTGFHRTADARVARC